MSYTFILILLVLFVWAALLVIMFSPTPKSKFNFQKFPEVDVPYVTIDIQGKLLNMVVDTGCGISILHEPILKDKELKFRDSLRQVNICALTDESAHMKSVTIDFEINKKTVSETFFINEAGEDFGGFQKLHGVQIHGILGSEFLDRHNCKVDYKKHQLIIC